MLFLITLIFQIGAAILYTPDWSYYHKTQVIHDKINQLKTTCPSLFTIVSSFIKTERQELPLFQQIEIKSQSPQEKIKAFIIFGQHAREMITSEVALQFLTNLCTQQNDEYSHILQNVEFIIVPIANTQGRQIVEEGQFCWRSNHNKIDMNRNWSFGHQESSQEDISEDSNGDAKPFTQEETKLLDSLIKQMQPHLLLDIHSGMHALLRPFGHKPKGDFSQYNIFIHEMDKLLHQIKADFCPECIVGNAYQALDYESFGNSMDHNFIENQVPISTTWEIYDFDATTQSNFDINFSIHNNLTEKTHRFKQVNEYNEQIQQKKLQQYDETQNCFHEFNPITLEDYQKTKNNWEKAIKSILELIIKDENKLFRLKRMIKRKKFLFFKRN